MTKTKSKDHIVTKSFLKKSLDGLADAILQGMDNMFKEERKHNVENFASKKDLLEVRDKLNAIQTDISWT